ncbi:MAG: serine hydrolase [Pseudomonadota bacterium]
MQKAGLCALVSLVISQAAIADNGQIAHAHPVSDIKIDGNLADWPKSIPSYPIQRSGDGDLVPANEGFDARFRAAYMPGGRSVFLAVEVKDDAHSVTADADPDWSAHDSVIAYLDFNHTKNGSASALYLALGDHRDMLSGEGSWDADVAKATWDQAEAVVKRHEGKTVYEWRIDAHKSLAANSVVGLDFLIADNDKHGQESSSTLYVWGPGFGKSQAGGTTGDLLLLPADAQLTTLSGKIGMVSPAGGVVPADSKLRVQVSSVDQPELWLQARSDETGSYQLDLPRGNYTITSASSMVRKDDEYPQVVGPSKPITVRVAGKAEVKAPTLGLKTMDLPIRLSERGALFTFGQDSETALDETVESLMKHFDVPGLSLALVKDGELRFHRRYGVRNAYSGEPVLEDTLFEAASITKAVFAFAVNRLAERGVIDLDKPLYEYLPFEDIAHDKRYQKITGRMALSHQTGFPNWRWANDDGKIDIKFYPGIKYGYSGEGFEYLGRVVSHLTGKSLEQVLLEEALQPMGFAGNTYFSDRPELHRQASRGHLAGMTGPHDFPGEVGVAHSMYTEAKTFSGFMVSLLARKGLSAEGYEKMLEPQVEVPLDPEERPQWPSRYGLGFHLMNTPYGLAYGHGGNNGNFTCQFEVYPEQNMGFAIFTNADSGSLLVNALREYLVIGSAEPQALSSID